MLNKVNLIGNLGKQPESKTLDNGTVLTTFSLATSETFKDKQGEKQTETQWHNVVMFGKVAEIAAKYLDKGSTVYIEGKIKTRSYEKDGQTKYVTDIIAKELKMLSRKEQTQNQQNAPIPDGVDPFSASLLT